MTTQWDSYSVSTFISFLNVKIFNTNHALLTNSKKLDRHHFYCHINLGWICNLRFDYWRTFWGFTWLHVVLTAPPMPSQRALIHSALIPKSCLWENKSSCSFCTVFHNCERSKLAFYYKWVISFQIINKNCLNLIQKACVMVLVTWTKTQWIMLEATIWSKVVYNQGMYFAVFFTPVVALDFVQYQELIIFSFAI